MLEATGGELVVLSDLDDDSDQGTTKKLKRIMIVLDITLIKTVLHCNSY